MPTEDEWQLAALAGRPASTKLKGEDLKKIGWFALNSKVAYKEAWECPELKPRKQKCGTHPVGRKRANAWQLYDMIGNVSEWTWSAAENGAGVSGLFSEVPRVRRGCSWYRRSCGFQERDQDLPTSRSFHIGFRVARTRQ